MSVAQGTEIRRTRFGQKELLRLHDLLVYIVLSLVGIIFLLPFAWMVANSLKTIKEIYRLPPTFIPDS